MPTFRDIPQYPHSAYQVDVSWTYLKEHLAQWDEVPHSPLILSPDYQRGYVWTAEQQTAYCEYILSGGTSGRDVFFNNPSWMGGFSDPTECVDGQQRIGAVLAFLDGHIPAFGYKFSEYTDQLRLLGPSFTFHVCKIKDRKELLNWYISMNTGGSIHTAADLSPAYGALAALT
jgi:hypothetical protein